VTTTDHSTQSQLAAPKLIGPPKALVSSTAHLLKRVAWMLKDRTVEAFEETDLTPYHHAVLVLLEEEPQETQAAIADSLGYDRSHLVELLDELEEGGLVERKRNPLDRRRHLVSLTPEGKKAASRLRPLVKRLEDEFLAPLTPEERETLHEFLLRLAKHHDPRYAADSPGADA
jgi:DNA-binding MarR family transcriptional regulator